MASQIRQIVTAKKMLRPPLPKSASKELEYHDNKPLTQDLNESVERQGYRDKSVSSINQKEHQHEPSSTNTTPSPEELVKLFQTYVSQSGQVNMEQLRKSESAKIKRYRQCTYFGELVNEKRHGLGIMLYHTANRVYEGMWESDVKHGKGYERFSNGSKYTGAYCNGKPQGFGTYLWPNGEIYQGEWSNGQKHGSGMWRGARADSYIGEWKFGKADGYGVHTWINGDVYEGEFKACLKHGEGVQKFSNGDRYAGNYVNGKPSGYGEYYWANGSFFKGNFKNGLRHGNGVWKKGQGESDKYQGEYINDKKCGYGIFSWAEGNTYKGNFFDDRRHGYGEMYWKDGSYYKGQWDRGVQHGQGQVYNSAYPDEPPRQGVFNENILIQEDTIQNQQSIQFANIPQIRTKDFGSRVGQGSLSRFPTHSSKQRIQLSIRKEQLQTPTSLNSSFSTAAKTKLFQINARRLNANKTMLAQNDTTHISAQEDEQPSLQSEAQRRVIQSRQFMYNTGTNSKRRSIQRAAHSGSKSKLIPLSKVVQRRQASPPPAAQSMGLRPLQTHIQQTSGRNLQQKPKQTPLARPPKPQNKRSASFYGVPNKIPSTTTARRPSKLGTQTSNQDISVSNTVKQKHEPTAYNSHKPNPENSSNNNNSNTHRIRRIQSSVSRKEPPNVVEEMNQYARMKLQSMAQIQAPTKYFSAKQT